MDPPAPPSSRPTCSATGRNGAPCRATPRSGRPFCTNHDPELRERMADARRRGGAARGKVGRERAALEGSSPPAEAPPPWLSLATLADVRTGYAWTAQALIAGSAGRIDARTANALAVLFAGASRVIEGPTLADLPDYQRFVDTLAGAIVAAGRAATGAEAAAVLLAALQKATGDAAETPPQK